MLETLKTDKYEKLPRNVDYFISLKLKRFVKKYEHMLTKPERRAISSFDYNTTNIYGVPKIHKSHKIKETLQHAVSSYMWLPNPEDLKFRLIFGGPNNPAVVLATLVHILVKPFCLK